MCIGHCGKWNSPTHVVAELKTNKTRKRVVVVIYNHGLSSLLLCAATGVEQKQTNIDLHK